MPDVDARILRLQQGAVAVILLASFVFSLHWMIPAAAVLPGLDAAMGPGGPTARFWKIAGASRLGAPRSWDTAAGARAQALLVFGALIVATLLLLGGLDAIATLLAIIVAGVSASAATGLFCVGAEIDRRSRPRRRGGSGR